MEGTVSLDLSQRSLWKLIPIYDADKDFGFYFVWLDPEAADAFLPGFDQNECATFLRPWRCMSKPIPKP
jgi:hypothetical protein